VNNPKAKIVELLESKRRLFEDMEKILTEQKNLLKEKELHGFRDKSEIVDDIIEKIKNVDYDIACLESDDENLSRMIDAGDDEVKKILNDIIKILRRNHSLMDELTGDLKKCYQELKRELGDTVEMGRISGYKTATQPAPVYFDKIN